MTDERAAAWYEHFDQTTFRQFGFDTVEKTLVWVCGSLRDRSDYQEFIIPTLGLDGVE